MLKIIPKWKTELVSSIMWYIIKVEIKRWERGSQGDFETGRILEEKTGQERTGDDLVQEIRENKRSSNMENVNSQKEWEEKCNEYLSSFYYWPNFKLLVYIFSTLGCRHSFGQHYLEHINN